jgi:cobalt-zinc-cadmium efflux system outer membrane protein
MTSRAAGQPVELAPDELVLGSELEVALVPPAPAAQPAPERLPDPFVDSVEEPIPLPPVETPADDDQLTLGEAESLALAFHPAVREAEGRLRAAQGNWVQVGLRPNPEIGYSGDEMGDAGTAGQQGGFISQEFVTAGKLRLNRSVASQEVAAALQRLELARLRVLTTVRTYYFDALAAERAVALARQLSDLASESVNVSEQRLKALDVPKVSLLQSQVERESAALLEEQATERQAAAWRRLNMAVGRNDTQMPALEDVLLRPLPDLQWETLRRRVLGGNPELAELRFAASRARWAVERASAGRVPNVNMELGVAHDNATDDEIANVRLSMPLPVFDRNQGAIAQACGELAAAQAAIQHRELALEQRLAAALRDYATARQRAVRFSENVLPVARQSLDMINAGYREGELDYMEVLTAQRTYSEKNLSYLQDLETAWKQWAHIEGLLVGPLADERN